MTDTALLRFLLNLINTLGPDLPEEWEMSPETKERLIKAFQTANTSMDNPRLPQHEVSNEQLDRCLTTIMESYSEKHK